MHQKYGTQNVPDLHHMVENYLTVSDMGQRNDVIRHLIDILYIEGRAHSTAARFRGKKISPHIDYNAAYSAASLGLLQGLESSNCRPEHMTDRELYYFLGNSAHNGIKDLIKVSMTYSKIQGDSYPPQQLEENTSLAEALTDKRAHYEAEKHIAEAMKVLRKHLNYEEFTLLEKRLSGVPYREISMKTKTPVGTLKRQMHTLRQNLAENPQAMAILDDLLATRQGLER